MQVKWEKFLTVLGCQISDPKTEARQPCPMHPTGDKTLIITRDPIRGFWRFTCVNTQCSFSGDAVALVSRLRHITLDEALNLFRPGNELAPTLMEDFTGTQLDDYASDRSSQVRLAGYLDRTQEALRISAKGDVLRNKLADHGALQRSSGSLQDVPRSLGLVLTDELPPILRELKRYDKVHCALYPYTYEGRITHIRVQNFDDDTLPSYTVPILRQDLGMFLEENVVDTTEQLLVMPNELMACSAYRKVTEVSATPLPIVALAGLPLPSRFKQLKRLYLVDLEDAPLTLETALRYFTASQITGNADQKVIVRVMLGTTAERFSHHRLMRPENTPDRVIGLALWLDRQIDNHIVNHNIEVVYRAFETVSVDEAHKGILLHVLTDPTVGVFKQPVQIAETIENAGKLRQNVLRLANGREIRRTPTGLIAVLANGTEKVLSNVALEVMSCLFTRNSDVKYVCKLRSALEAPSIMAQFQPTDFLRAANVLKAVQNRFLLQGQSVYPAFYDIPGYQWPDILGKLAEGKDVRQEITSLGTDNELIHFPHITLNTIHRTIEPQKRAYTLSPYILQMYSGLRHYDAQLDSQTALRKLVEAAATNVYCAGLLAGICQLVYLLVRSTKQTAPQHIFYIEPEPGLWLPIFGQLVQLLSETDDIPRLPAVKLRDYLNHSRQLGNLPCIQTFPELSIRATSRAVADSPVSLISLLANDRANRLVGDTRTSFVVMPDHTTQTTYALDPQDIVELRHSLPGFLLQMLVYSPTSIEREAFQSLLPAIAGLHAICRLLKLPHTNILDTIVQQYHTVSGMSCSYSFLHVLKQLLEQPDIGQRIRIMQGAPTDRMLRNDKPPEIFVLQDCVYIGHQIVTIINHLPKQVLLFSPPSLTQDFERCGHLCKDRLETRIDINRYWPLDRKIWNRYVIGEPLALKPVTSGNVIRLPRLIA